MSSSRSCTQCFNRFEIGQTELQFLEKLAPTLAGQKFELPQPTLCPNCRQQRRSTYRNDQHYYRSNCHFCKKSLISIYSPDKDIPSLCEDCYWGDDWSPNQYNRDFDFSKSFFEQFFELKRTVPRLSIFNTKSENSKYTVHSSRNKDCYMGSSLIDCEGVLYGDFVHQSRECIDCFNAKDSELCYDAAHIERCYSSQHLEHCSDLAYSQWCFDCRGSSNLLGCVGLRKRSNAILNLPAHEQEIANSTRLISTNPTYRQEFMLKFEQLKKSQPKPAFWSLNSEDSFGNYLTNCKDVAHGFMLRNCRETFWLFDSTGCTDCMDGMRVAEGELVYESAAIVDLKNSAFCNLTYQCESMLYCDNCQNNCRNCFGCIGLKNAQYHILNKPYSREQYELLVPKIITHMRNTNEWGEFFPMQSSPFGYNESKAQEWFPLSRSQCSSSGLTWSDFDQPLPGALRTLKAENLPDSIDQVSDEILEIAIICSLSGKPFRVTSKELDFYRAHDIALPHFAPRERHLMRIRKQSPRQVNASTCAHCQQPIMTCYQPQDGNLVCCQACYEKALY